MLAPATEKLFGHTLVEAPAEKSNNNLVYCPSSPPFNDHAAVAPTSVRGIPNGPPQNQKLPSKNDRVANISLNFLSDKRLTALLHIFFN